jgi:hypothetical protein
LARDEVAEFRASELVALARLHVLEIEDRERLSFIKKFEAFFEIAELIHESVLLR